MLIRNPRSARGGFSLAGFWFKTAKNVDWANRIDADPDHPIPDQPFGWLA